jgi:hypothetical protein
MQKVSIAIWLFSLFLLPTTLFSLPTPPTFLELVENSNYIVKVKLTKINQKKFNKQSIAVNAVAEIQETFKTAAPLPSSLNLSFFVFPEIYGKWFKQVPVEGVYILFLINKPTKDKDGNISNAIVLYEPHPYAIYVYKDELVDQIKNTLIKP